MFPFILKTIGEKTVHKSLKSKSKGFFDIKLGFKLFRDRRVSQRAKFLSISFGCLLLAAMLALELPVETVLASLLIGLPIDFALDGLEMVVAPVIFSSLLLPWIAPRNLVEKIVGESDGLIIDVAS